MKRNRTTKLVLAAGAAAPSAMAAACEVEDGAGTDPGVEDPALDDPGLEDDGLDDDM